MNDHLFDEVKKAIDRHTTRYTSISLYWRYPYKAVPDRYTVLVLLSSDVLPPQWFKVDKKFNSQHDTQWYIYRLDSDWDDLLSS